MDKPARTNCPTDVEKPLRKPYGEAWKHFPWAYPKADSKQQAKQHQKSFQPEKDDTFRQEEPFKSLYTENYREVMCPKLSEAPYYELSDNTYHYPSWKRFYGFHRSTSWPEAVPNDSKSRRKMRINIFQPVRLEGGSNFVQPSRYRNNLAKGRIEVAQKRRSQTPCPPCKIDPDALCNRRAKSKSPTRTVRGGQSPTPHGRSSRGPPQASRHSRTQYVEPSFQKRSRMEDPHQQQQYSPRGSQHHRDSTGQYRNFGYEKSAYGAPPGQPDYGSPKGLCCNIAQVKMEAESKPPPPPKKRSSSKCCDPCCSRSKKDTARTTAEPFCKPCAGQVCGEPVPAAGHVRYRYEPDPRQDPKYSGHEPRQDGSPRYSGNEPRQGSVTRYSNNSSPLQQQQSRHQYESESQATRNSDLERRGSHHSSDWGSQRTSQSNVGSAPNSNMPVDSYDTVHGCPPPEEYDRSHAKRCKKCCKKAKKRQENLIYNTHGYLPCQAEHAEPDEDKPFNPAEGKVDYMEFEGNSGRYVRNPLTVSACTCNMQPRGPPPKTRNTKAPPPSFCCNSGNRSQTPVPRRSAGRKSHTDDHTDTTGIPPLSQRNLHDTHFVPQTFFNAKQLPKRSVQPAAGQATSRRAQKRQRPVISPAGLRAESSLHLNKQRLNPASRRLSGSGSRRSCHSKSLKRSIASKLPMLHVDRLLNLPSLPKISPFKLRFADKSKRMGDVAALRLKMSNMRGGKSFTAASTNPKHKTNSRQESQLLRTAARPNQLKAASSVPKRSQSMPVKRDRSQPPKTARSPSTPPHPRNSRSVRKITKATPPRSKSLPGQSTNTRNRQEKPAPRNIPQQRKPQQILSLPGQLEVQESDTDPGENDLPEAPPASPSPSRGDNTQLILRPETTIHPHNQDGCLGTNIHHFYRGSFLAIRPPLTREEGQPSGQPQVRLRQSLTGVSHYAWPTMMERITSRGTSFVVPNKWLINGFITGSPKILQLHNGDGARRAGFGKWLWRKLWLHRLFNGKTGTTSA